MKTTLFNYNRHHETDGKFAVTKFVAVNKFEKCELDRSQFFALCAKFGLDGSLFAAPNGFSKWTDEKKIS